MMGHPNDDMAKREASQKTERKKTTMNSPSAPAPALQATAHRVDCECEDDKGNACINNDPAPAGNLLQVFLLRSLFFFCFVCSFLFCLFFFCFVCPFFVLFICFCFVRFFVCLFGVSFVL